ncbi:hypothetical protein [Streptacidiphilus cavernicola]|uniref:Helix-turn-helix domain-containing protein n=1 Tax=Streptacidiphilus cavernicola TaxID=3342716 RepID=A0ABV6VYC3_9ACTN
MARHQREEREGAREAREMSRAQREQHRETVDGFVVPLSEVSLRWLARGTTAVLLPGVALILAALAISLAVVNVTALHAYLHAADAPYGLDWAAPASQEGFVLAGESMVMLNAVLLRRWPYALAGLVMSLAGNASALWWHFHDAAPQFRWPLAMVVVFGAVALMAFIAVTHRAVHLIAVHSAREGLAGSREDREEARDLDPAERPVKIAEAARVLDVKDSTIRSWIHQGALANRNPNGEPMCVLLRDVVSLCQDRGIPYTDPAPVQVGVGP